MDFDRIKKEVKNRMSEKRYMHSERVSDNAAILAKKFGQDEEKARWAGMLHDIAKELGDDRFLSIAEKNGIPISDAERQSPHRLHGKVGAVIARDELGITDKDILSGIFNHFGCAGMTDFEEVIFLADVYDKLHSVEEDKTLDEFLAAETVDDAILFMLSYNLMWQEKGLADDDADIRVIYDYILDKKMRKNGSEVDLDEWSRKREAVYSDEQFDKLLDINTTHSVGVTSVKNIRDLGGYDTNSGKKIRAGKLIRSAVLEKLTQEDADRLYDMGVNYVIDLRSEADQKGLPDINIDKFNKETCELSTIEKTEYQKELIGISKGLLVNPNHREGEAWMNGEFLREMDMEQMYKDILSSESSVKSIRKMFEILMRDDCTGAVIHCRDGKDRTGIAAMIILFILDVHLNDIAMDYMASAIPNYAITEIYDAYFSCNNYDDEIITNSTREKSVDKNLILSIQPWFKENYGGMSAYVHDVLGLDDGCIKKIRNKYVTG